MNMLPTTGQPALASFSLNMTPPEQLLLTFNTAVGQSCDSQRLTLQNSATSPTSSVMFQSAVCTYQSGIMVLSVTIDSEEWRQVQAEVNLATQISNTFISLDADFVLDTNAVGNPAVLGFQATMFTENTNPPILITGLVDIQTRLLGLLFSEGIDISSVSPTGVTVSFTNMMTGLRQSRTLTGGNPIVIDTANQVGILLDPADSDIIRLSSPNPAEFLIAIDPNTVLDANGTPNLRQENISLFMFISDDAPPIIDSFTLDLDSGSMILIFSELIVTDQGSIDYSGINITRGDIFNEDGFSLEDSTVVTVTSGNVTNIALQLSANLLNLIISDATLCSSIQNCFITWANDTFRDVSNNPTVEVPSPIQAGTIFPDTTAPNLTSFRVDLSSGLLNVSFSEPVNITVFQISDFRFTDGASQQASVNGTIVSPDSGFGVDVSIALTSDSLNFAKVLRTPNLAVDSSATTDIAGNFLVQIDISNSLSPSIVVPDQTPPILLGFTAISSPTPQIILTFDEYVDPSSWNGNQLSLTFLVSAGDIMSSTFNSGTVSSTSSNRLTYTFSSSEFVPPFSSQYTEAFNSGSIVLTTNQGLVRDSGGNLLNSSGPFTYSTQPPDTTSPTLLGFDLDVDSGSLRITFSEPVNILVVAGQVQIISSSIISSGIIEYTLVSNGTRSMGMGPLPVLDLMLATEDLNGIKVNSQLGTASNNTFLLITSGLGADRSGNPLRPGVNGVPVSTYTPDTVPPTMLMSTFDLNAGLLLLQFSEPVSIESNSVDLSQVYLAAMSTNSQSNISVTGSSFQSSISDTLITITLTVSVLNSIKFDGLLCTSTTNCYVNTGLNSFRDTSGNVVPENTMSYQIAALIPDTSVPSLLSYDLNLNTGYMVMTFSEPINSVTFNPTGLSFVVLSLSPSGPTYSPSEAFITRTEGFNTIITINLGPSLNQVKQVNSNDPGNIGLTMTMSAVTDVASNPVLVIDMTSPEAPSSITPDTTPPTLTTFMPGANQSDITFIFSEYVNGSALQASQITLRLSTLQGTFEYSGFSGGTITSDSISDQITYRFSPSDFNTTLRNQYSEAITSGSVSLLVREEFITDLNNNFLLPISSPLQFSTDTVRPTLVSFTLDLNEGILDLSFSEVVNILSVATMIRLQNTASNPTSVYTLAGNGTLVPDALASDAISIFMSEVDVIAIKVNQDIGTSIANTYLELEETIARDLSGNLFTQGPSALQAMNFTLDTSRPRLSSSSVNLNDETLLLQFTEAISTTTVNLSLIYITGTIQSQATEYNLSSSTHTELFSTSVLVQFSVTVLNRIKADTSVCTMSLDCFTFISEGALSDVSGNQVIPSSSSDLVTSLMPDLTPPQLISYTLNLNSGITILTFSEPILVSSLMSSSITALSGSSSVGLGDVSILGTESSNTIVRLQAGSGLLNQLKMLSSLGPISFSASSNAATDTSTLSLVAIPPSNSISPSSLVLDNSPPVLREFIPSSGGNLQFTLVFDEFVQPNSLANNLLSFRLKNRNGHFDFADLSSAVVTPQMQASDRLTLVFPPSETRFTTTVFQQLYLSSYNEGSICLNLATSFVTDVSGNSYAGDLLVVYTNSSDNERPVLISFTLNLNTSILNLTFSESVTILTTAGNVRFQDRSTSPLNVYNLMQNGTIVMTQNLPSDTVAISLDASDLNNILASPSLATSTMNTYLYLLEQFAVDLSGNLLADPPSAIQASQVTQVITGTMLISFDLDLDSDIMTLQFDRGVNVSTLDSTRITLTNTTNPSAVARSNVQLSNVEVIALPSSILSQFRFVLRTNDSINVKSSVLCYDRANCFASFMSGLVLDSTGNGTNPVTLQVNTLFLDVTPPRLLAYINFDLNQGTFTLIFSEPVNSSSADFTDIQFSNRVTNPTSTVTLREGFTSRDHVEIDFTVTNTDLNILKLLPNLCTSRDNCWVRLPSFFINDIGMNPFLHSSIQPDAQASFHQPLVFLEDVTSPFLVQFSIDMNIGNMILSFSEVIAQASFYPENITLLNGPSGTSMYRLSSSTSFSRSSTGDEIYLNFTVADYNSIRSLPLCTSLTDSYISLVTEELIDASGNIFSDVPLSDPFQAFMFLSDNTRPLLVSFEIYNNDNGIIEISFNEPVDITTIDPREITLLSQSINSPQAITYTLTGGISGYLRNDELTITITMTASDLREVKLITNLATGRENTFIAITNRTIIDRNSNSVQSISRDAPLQLSSNGFVSDSSRASIAGFTFDLNDEIISLTFTDVLDISTLDLTQMTVQNSRSSPLESYTLSDSTVVSPNSDNFNISLGSQDKNAIQLNFDLATSEANTFISFGSSLIRDVSGLEVISVPSSAAIGAALYIEDSVNPRLSFFNLDMNAGMILLSFSEAVLINYTMLSTITIQNSDASPTMSYGLTGGSLLEASSDTRTALSLNITLLYNDLNQIKSLQNLASGSSDTYIQVIDSFIIDTNNNSIIPSVTRVRIFTPDSIQPVLLYFNLDLSVAGILQLKFSEAISYTTSTPATVVLQDTSVNPSQALPLTVVDMFITLPSLDTVEIRVRQELLLILLRNPSIATTTDQLYISLSNNNGFRDFSGNNIVSIPSSQAQRVQYICKWNLYYHSYVHNNYSNVVS